MVVAGLSMEGGRDKGRRGRVFFGVLFLVCSLCNEMTHSFEVVHMRTQ